ncbi:hypothetical protein NDU88_001064 [Pleurodeles waltl]|uniref:Reverse transcriptase/retrotransposon-derived protein RNase H-like domain-containing protein n=1 Tax=Pleurodeles waltl TaxID=8319 RepID=A0AAV7PA35_PLEWA|nr:hypothetical protein NDU88_001064 [Pleurodeles waltl]
MAGLDGVPVFPRSVPDGLDPTSNVKEPRGQQEVREDHEDLQRFLAGVPLPSLEPGTREAYGLISREVILTTIRRHKTTKTQGSDGLPAEFYHHYVDIVTERLLVFPDDVLAPALTTSMPEVLVVMILKPGRDPPRFLSI